MILAHDGVVPEGVAAYTFDTVFNTDASQTQLYETSVRPAVQAVLEGFNATVLAYG